MTDKVKIGLAGCGPKGAQVMYAPILRLLQAGHITALMDPDPVALEYMQAYCPDAAMFTDYDTFLAQADIEAVIVATPVYLHCQQVVKAARARKHILCEKPMARILDECDAMIAACRAAGVLLMVGFMKRFDTSFRLAWQMVEAGELGEVFEVRCEFEWHIPDAGDEGWRAKRVTWGGMLQDHGSHTIDLCRWWLGDIESVSAEVRIVRPEREVEDLAIATLRHRNGALSTHHVTGVTHKALREYYLLEGTRASLELAFGPAWSYTATAPFRMTLYKNGNTTRDVTPGSEPNLDDELRAHSHYLREIEHFCQCVQRQAEPDTTGVDGRKAIEVINAAYVSAWRREKVRLPLQQPLDLEAFFRSQQPMGCG
jgi:predicted dehydrogenase